MSQRRSLTQQMARYIYDHQYDGIYYQSRCRIFKFSGPKMILLAAEGLNNDEIADGWTYVSDPLRPTASTW